MNAWLRSVCGSIGFLMVFGWLSASAAFGGAVHEKFDFIQEPVYVPCIDEEVAGILHISQVVNQRVSANGGLHYTSTGRQQGDLTGLSSGVVWMCNGVSNFKVNTQGEQVSLSEIASITCVAPGQPVLLYKYRIVGAQNANGVLSTLRFFESITCKGKAS